MAAKIENQGVRGDMIMKEREHRFTRMRMKSLQDTICPVGGFTSDLVARRGHDDTSDVQWLRRDPIMGMGIIKRNAPGFTISDYPPSTRINTNPSISYLQDADTDSKVTELPPIAGAAKPREEGGKAATTGSLQGFSSSKRSASYSSADMTRFKALQQSNKAGRFLAGSKGKRSESRQQRKIAQKEFLATVNFARDSATTRSDRSIKPVSI